jgi:hypothetical protein
MRKTAISLVGLSFLSRGDRTPLELFMAGFRGWEAGLRRQVGDDKADDKPSPDQFGA